MNRSERRQLDRDAKKSIATIRAHLEFLNKAGNPKYKLTKIYPFKQRIKDFLRLS